MKFQHDQHCAVPQQGGSGDAGHAREQAFDRFQHDLELAAEALDLQSAERLAGLNDDGMKFGGFLFRLGQAERCGEC